MPSVADKARNSFIAAVGGTDKDSLHDLGHRYWSFNSSLTPVRSYSIMDHCKSKGYRDWLRDRFA